MAPEINIPAAEEKNLRLVTLCIDCNHRNEFYEYDHDGPHWCHRIAEFVRDDDFCSFAEPMPRKAEPEA